MRTQHAAAIYMLLSGASALFFSLIFTVNLVYQTITVGLNPLQLVLVGTLLETVCFLTQVPTGILADMYSRRAAVVLGLLLIGCGFLVEGLFPFFSTVLLAQVLWGLGVTLMDGADAAWIADEVGPAQAASLYQQAGRIGALASLLGLAASAALASIRLNLPIALAGGCFLLLGVVLAMVMPERNFRPLAREERTTWQQMGHTLGTGIGLLRSRPVLLVILGIGLFHGLFSEGYDRLWQYHLLRHFTFPVLGGLKPVVWFPLIAAGSTIFTVLLSAVLQRRLDTQSHRAVARTLRLLDLAMICGMTVLALAGQFGLALCGYGLVAVARNVRGPLELLWMNQSLESEARATVLSLRGQVDALAQIAGGPILGVIATLWGTPLALLSAALLLTPTLLLYARTLSSGQQLVQTQATSG